MSGERERAGEGGRDGGESARVADPKNSGARARARLCGPLDHGGGGEAAGDVEHHDRAVARWLEAFLPRWLERALASADLRAAPAAPLAAAAYMEV